MASFYIYRDSLEDRERVCKAISALDATKDWSVEIKRKVKRRSLPQNALVHKLFDLIAEEMGEADPEDVKTFLKEKFLKKKLVLNRQIAPSTASLDVGEMAEFITNIEIFCHQMWPGIKLPSKDNY